MVAAVSALAGVAGGVITNMLTDRWSLTWAVALGVTASILVLCQVILSRSQAHAATVAAGPGAIAAAGKIAGDIDVRVRGQGWKGGAPAADPSGVSATGAGSIASGGHIRGKIRTDISET